MGEIKKAIILAAGMATRFLPLSKVVSKEFLPLADKPTFQYLLEEAIASGINEVIFVVSPGKKSAILDYFKKSPKLEKLLKEKKRANLLAGLQEAEKIPQNLSFTFVVQKEPLGDGHAILQAKKAVGNESCAVFFADDVLASKTPGLLQLLEVYKTCKKPVVALKKLPKEKLPHYGVVATDKIASRLHKIKKIVEKPSLESAPSDLAVVGRYVITPEIFQYLKDLLPDKRGEIVLANALEKMIADGKIVYGRELDGDWLECGNKILWLKSNLYFSLKHPEFSPELKKYLKEIL